MIARSGRLGKFLSVGVLIASVIIVGAFIRAFGYDPAQAARAAWRASFGSPFAIFSGTLKRATPLIALGIAVSVAFRAGVLNIGADGQFLAGASAAVAAGLALSGLPPAALLPIELAAGACGGAMWAGIAAILRRRYDVTEVVSTLLLNFVAVNLIGYLVRGPLQEPSRGYPESSLLGSAARLPLLVRGQRLHYGFAIACVLAGGAWWFATRAASGFRARVVGTSPSVARSASLIDVAVVKSRALVASGAIAGIAGFSEVAGVTYRLYDGLSPGYGYTAIAVALLAGLNPIGVLVSGVMFGALGAGADGMQRDAGIPAEFATIVAALVILGALVLSTVQRASGEHISGEAS